MTLSPRCVRRSPNVAAPPERLAPICGSRDVLSLDRTNDQRMSEQASCASFVTAGLSISVHLFALLISQVSIAVVPGKAQRLSDAAAAPLDRVLYAPGDAHSHNLTCCGFDLIVLGSSASCSAPPPKNSATLFCKNRKTVPRPSRQPIELGRLRRPKEWKTRSIQLARDPEPEKLEFLI